MKKNLFIKHTWKYLLLVIVGMFFSLQVLAQSLVVKGSVVDKNGEAIIGANILVKGTTNGSITDFDGNFTLDANKGDILVVSFIGSLLSGENSLKQLLLTNNQLVTRLIKFFD